MQLVNPPGLNRWVVQLEDQRVHVDRLPELANPPLDFALGPRGGQPAFWVLLPPAAALDVPIGLGMGTAFMTAAGAVMIFYYRSGTRAPTS